MPSFATPLGARALRTHRLLMRIVHGTSVFAWLLIFQSFFVYAGFEHALFATVVLFVCLQILAFFLTPLSAPALRFGVRRALAFGTLFASFSSASFALLFAPVGVFDAFALLVAFVIFSAIHRALYWVPYESVTPHTAYSSLPEFILISIPFCLGLLLSVPGFGMFVFIGASVCALCALIPLVSVPERVEAFEWNTTETLFALFSRRNRDLLIRGMLDGIQGAGLLLLWPIVIFVIIRGDWFLFGFILSLTLLMTLLLRSWVQKTLKRIHADRSDVVLGLIALGAWGARLVSPAPIAILASDVFAHTTISPKRFSIDIHGSMQSADAGHFIDEYTALKEMALHLGRIIACVLCIALISLSAQFALAGTLFLAGCAAAVSVVLARRAARAI